MYHKISKVQAEKFECPTIIKALVFLTGFMILPHFYASYFISVIYYSGPKPIEQFVDAGNMLYVVSYLLYAFLPRSIRELTFFNFLYFLSIYGFLMFAYLFFRYWE